MAKNYFNINDNYPKNCDKITKKKIDTTPLNIENSKFLKAIKAKNKWQLKQAKKYDYEKQGKIKMVFQTETLIEKKV